MVPRVQAVVDAVTKDRRRFERFCRSLTAGKLARPVPGSEWTVHDFISHVVTLDQAYAGWFAELAGMAVAGAHRGTVGFDVDEFNQHEVAETRAAVIAELSRLTDDQLAGTIRFGGDASGRRFMCHSRTSCRGGRGTTRFISRICSRRCRSAATTRNFAPG